VPDPDARASPNASRASETRWTPWSTTCRPKSGMGKAFTYACGQWDTPVVFLADATAPRQNSTSERLLRGSIVGRKNWLFSGSTVGAQLASTPSRIYAIC